MKQRISIRFGAEVRSSRERAEIRLATLAERIGVGTSVLSLLERGRDGRRWSIDLVCRAIKGLQELDADVSSITALLSGEMSNNPHERPLVVTPPVKRDVDPTVSVLNAALAEYRRCGGSTGDLLKGFVSQRA